MHERQALLGLHLDGMRGRIRKAFAHEHHFAAEVAHGFDLENGSGHGHHDDGTAPEAARREGHALGVVAGRGADHAAGALFGAQMHHLVEGAAQLEGEHRLGVLALEKNLVADSQRQTPGFIKRRLAGNVVNARGEDPAQVVLTVNFCLCHFYSVFAASLCAFSQQNGSQYTTVYLFLPRPSTAVCQQAVLRGSESKQTSLKELFHPAYRMKVPIPFLSDGHLRAPEGKTFREKLHAERNPQRGRRTPKRRRYAHPRNSVQLHLLFRSGDPASPSRGRSGRSSGRAARRAAHRPQRTHAL